MEQTIRYYHLTPYLANYLKKYTKYVIHSFIHGEHVYAMVDTPELHPLVIYFTGCSIPQDEYWRAYITEKPLLHVTGKPKIVNGVAMLSLQYHSKELIKILQTTGRFSLKKGGNISLTSDRNIRFSKISTGFEQILSNEVEVCYFEHIMEFVKDSTQEILDTYDKALRQNHKILNTKYELKI